MITKVSDPFI